MLSQTHFITDDLITEPPYHRPNLSQTLPQHNDCTDNSRQGSTLGGRALRTNANANALHPRSGRIKIQSPLCNCGTHGDRTWFRNGFRYRTDVGNGPPWTFQPEDSLPSAIDGASTAAISPAPGPVHIISSLQHLVAGPSRPGRRCDCTDVDENSATWACEWSHMRHLTSSMLRRLLHSGRLLSMHSDI